jgi:hypothetical protein
VVRLPHRLRRPGLWGIEADIFTTDLALLGLDPRTERSLREAIESYRRGVLLAAASLLGAAVEGAWYAAAQRLRPTAPWWTRSPTATAPRNSRPRSPMSCALACPATAGGSGRAQHVRPAHARHPPLRLFLETHRHLKRLAELTAQSAGPA